jgi:hypothetical protein
MVPSVALAFLVAGDGDDDGAVGVVLGRSRTAAATKAATPDFMSVAPRPQSCPSRISPPKGSAVQAAASPTGTTSVWPLKPKVRGCPFAPQRAKRFGVWPRSTRVAGEARACQHPRQKLERAALEGRDGRAAHERGRSGRPDRRAGVMEKPRSATGPSPSKNGVSCATITAFSSSARCISARSSRRSRRPRQGVHRACRSR